MKFNAQLIVSDVSTLTEESKRGLATHLIGPDQNLLIHALTLTDREACYVIKQAQSLPPELRKNTQALDVTVEIKNAD